MNCRYYTLLLIILTFSGLYGLAQSEAVSPRLSFNIAREVKPPIWEMVEEPYFVDADGNHAIDAQEKCKIVMKIKNIGLGEGKGLRVVSLRR